jgi:hypothetical protein
MKSMCRFLERSSETSIAINPALVRLVRESGDGGTILHFDNNHTVTVSEEFSDVVMSLEKAF